MIAPRKGRRGDYTRGTALPAPALTTSSKQDEFLTAVFSGDYKYLAFGGGIRGTKTWTVLIAVIMLCKMFPGSRWAVVRKDLPTLRRNTIPSINKIRHTVSGFVGELNQSTWTYRCANGSEIIIFPESYATDPDLDRWKGLEVNGFVLEEANELTEKANAKAIERAGSWIIPGGGPQPPILILYTFNPAANWVKSKFYDPWKMGTMRAPYFFLPATIMDNPYASEDYKESLKNLPPEDYRRFVEGEWEGSDDPDQLIKAEWLWTARDVEPLYGDNALGVDVARFGDDKTVFSLVSGNALVWIKAFSQLSTDRTAMTAMAFAGDELHYVDPTNVRVDDIGVGGGVTDLLRKGGYTPYAVISGAKPIPRGRFSFYRFFNLRSQMWWEAREKLRKGLISLPQELPAELIGDLTAPRYTIRADKTIYVESKEDVKERIGRSTDFADAFIYSLFDKPIAPPRPEVPKSRSRVTLR